MIFAVEIGSRATRDESYTLRLPLTVSPHSTLPCISNVEIETYRATIREEPFVHVLEISGFSSDGDAREFAKPLRAACAWVDLNHHVGLLSPATFSEIDLFDEPQPVSEGSNLAPITQQKGWSAVDGHYCHDHAVIVPEHKRLIRHLAGRPRIVSSPTGPRTIATLLEALRFPNVRCVFNDNNLRLALELYSGSFFERSENAQFLLLITTLEALARIKGFGKAKALGLFVAAELQSDPEISDEKAVGSEVEASYRLRNDLVHEGVAVAGAIGRAKVRLIDIVARVLRNRFRRAAGG